MRSCLPFVLFLISTVEGSGGDRFLITAPKVFHVGVKEKVSVQLGVNNLNKPITLYITSSLGTLVSNKETVTCTGESKTETVELKVDRERFLTAKGEYYNNELYFKLVAENIGTKREYGWVLVSDHRGYIFIQTDQPMYNPTQLQVKYRVFTLDHMFRPHEETVCISAFNADGNRIMKTFRTAKGGIFQGYLSIPSVAKMGTWRITAYYEGDKANAVSREFKVQKFVLPSFEVNIEMMEPYVLLNNENLKFTISAMYSYGEKVGGAYHCQFGVKENHAAHSQSRPKIIKGLELTGSIQDGKAKRTVLLDEINSKLKEHGNTTLLAMKESKSQLYLEVFVTNIKSGEMQQGEVYLPIFSQKYRIDLSRTRSHFLQGYPLDVVVVMQHLLGTPAVKVPVSVTLRTSSSSTAPETWQGFTDEYGLVTTAFNVPTCSQITVEVSSEGVQSSKTLLPVSSDSGSHIYMSITNKLYSVGDELSITFSTINAPASGHIHFLVLSRGMIIQTGSLPLGTAAKHILRITADMVPSFRVVGYFHDSGNKIIADSVWVDVKNKCELDVKIEHEGKTPGKTTKIHLDLNGQRATVASLVVDKAFYALKADNKLTDKQVFSAMDSYDLGCSYGGGANPKEVLKDAGLTFVSNSEYSQGLSHDCHSKARRSRRSVDLKQKMEELKMEFEVELQECCTQAFSVLPMRRTCVERAERVKLVSRNETCADVFLKCCNESEKLRQQKMLEETQLGLGRTSTPDEIKDIIHDTTQYIRRFFPPSFDFKQFEVDGKKSYSMVLPDSITTWELQMVTLSPHTGLCVVKPYEIKAFKPTFVSLKLPYSVKKYEQISISPVIYNYGDKELTLAVHMQQTEGLCSPGSATTSSYVEVTVKNQSSNVVYFSAVPMVTGSIPIQIRLVDIENGWGMDAVQKSLKVQTEGLEQRTEKTSPIELDGRSSRTLYIDGTLPDNTVPDSNSNMFISVEGEGFGSSYARKLLSPEKVANLITLPTGCLEQTMSKLTPTVLAIRYLDLSNQFFNLPPDTRDKAMDHLDKGYSNIIKRHTGRIGGYASFPSSPYSTWMTAHVVRVFSLIAERQTAASGPLGRGIKIVPEEDIRTPVKFLLSVQHTDGSFSDSNSVVHRDLSDNAWRTAFITLALKRSVPFLKEVDQPKVEAAMLKAREYLQNQFPLLSDTYSVALTAYCLSVLLPTETERQSVWAKLKSKAITDDQGCYMWTENTGQEKQKATDAKTIETTAYALLTAVAVEDFESANQTACWLSRKEKYNGGYLSTQDTLMVLEALSEYELKLQRAAQKPYENLTAEFSVSDRIELSRLEFTNDKESVELDLKHFTGSIIKVELKGKGNFKLKSVKAYHLLEPKDDCSELNLRVTVEGKVKYTPQIIENYDYYEDDADKMDQTAEVLTRNRRSVENDAAVDNVVTYTVCAGVASNSTLTGMAIADITLLSGFEAESEDLEKLKQPPEQYITHFELSFGRVLIYLDKLYEKQTCFSFDAIQRVVVELLQPAPAVFYDYYQPNRQCTVFYSAPKRSDAVSKLCSDDVCQCAERPCHKMKETFKKVRGRQIMKGDRFGHACFSPTVDYAYLVEVKHIIVKSNFELYTTEVNEVLKQSRDLNVVPNSERIFAKRLQCKGQLEVGKQYLIMGKDGSTKDSSGRMQYLLESNTWIERKPDPRECQNSLKRKACKEFDEFSTEYKTNGCRQ